MDQSKAPLYDKLKALANKQRYSFHVPGHKFGQAFTHEQPDGGLLKQWMAIDYTEIPGLDDLHDPQGVIDEAQRLAAEYFRADETFFLVNGSTVGNIALILSVCSQGDLILVQRDVHKSILHGLMLAKAKAVFLPPRWDAASGLFGGVEAPDVEAALQQYPEAKAVFLTNPNYYGKAVDLKPIVKIVHRYHIPLFIDEAHGAHFGLHPGLPSSALDCGADAAVQSTHKMLLALTMGAMLHVRSDFLNLQRLRQSLTMLQSSSPSYPIMASLDFSRRWMATRGEQSLTAGMELIQHFKLQLQQLPWFSIAADLQQDTEFQQSAQDPFKIAIRDRTNTLSGYELKGCLERHGCMAELADPVYVLLVFSLASQKCDSEKLMDSLRQISRQFSLDKQELHDRISNINILPIGSEISPPIRFSLPNLEYHEGTAQRWIPLQEAVGRRSADMVVPYPPGIALLYPGEVITREMADYLQQLSTMGAGFQGSEFIHRGQIKVWTQ